jgi:hypothetical protein
LFCRLKFQAAARNALKKQTEDEAEYKSNELGRISSVAGLMKPVDHQNRAAGVLKGSDPSLDCQSYPSIMKVFSEVKQGEEYDFLKRGYDIPQRVTVQTDCNSVNVSQLKSQYKGQDNDNSMNDIDFDQLNMSNIDDEDFYLEPMSAIQEMEEPASMRRSPKKWKSMSKEDWDRQLDRDVTALESGSFFDLYELGDVVSVICLFCYLFIIILYTLFLYHDMPLIN